VKPRLRDGHSAASSSAAARLGRALAAFRRRAGLSQEDVAERASLSVRGLRNLELGLVERPRHSTVAALTAALGMSPEAAADVDRLARAARSSAAGRPASRGEVAEVERSLMVARECGGGRMRTPEDIALAAIGAVEQRDGQKLLDLYHDEIEFQDAPSLPYGGVVTGKAAVSEHMYSPAGWAATWLPLQPTAAERSMSPRIVASAGEDVVIEYRQRALAPNGERFDSPVIGMYKVRDGRLIRARMFHFDTAAMVAFLRRANGPESG
jgi:transcriptional regulator with XRE-family HTH domain